MTKTPESRDEIGTSPAPKSLLERLDDRIASVNPDIWLAGAVFAVIVPWLNRLA